MTSAALTAMPAMNTAATTLVVWMIGRRCSHTFCSVLNWKSRLIAQRTGSPVVVAKRQRSINSPELLTERPLGSL
jgi:hypothetical protein